MIWIFSFPSSNSSYPSKAPIQNALTVEMIGLIEIVRYAN